MGKILLVLASLVLVGCNENATQNDAVTITRDYQDSQHATNDAAFEYARLARLAQREALLAQH